MNNTYLLALLARAPYPGAADDPSVKRLLELVGELETAVANSDWGAVDRIRAEVETLTGGSR